MALPPVPQPRGVKYYLRTWSGRLLVINAIVFIAMVSVDGSILLPSKSTLMMFGVRDPVAIASGELWRLFTPIFVHIGAIHFFFNASALHYIGFQLETILGGKWFLITYFLAGIIGNIASGLFTPALSAGASGAIFGLAGAGFLLERIVGNNIEQHTGRRPRKSVYAGVVVINIVLGFLIPGIDNAAHLGGLVTGVIVTYSALRIRPNRLMEKNKRLGYIALAALLSFASVGVALESWDRFIVLQLIRSAKELLEDDLIENDDVALNLYRNASQLDPADESLKLTIEQLENSSR